MIERAIQVGDLTVRVRSCCGIYIGTVRRVEGFGVKYDTWCKGCGKRTERQVSAYFEGDEPPSASPIEYLKRIPPLSELESTDETQKEPA